MDDGKRYGMLTLLDYKNEEYETGIDLDNLDDVLTISIEVVTGDEIAHVIYKDGHSEYFDSCPFRLTDYYDGGYTLYVAGSDCDERERFVKRRSSYTIFEEVGNESASQ